MESKFELEVPISQLTYSNVKMSPPLHVVPYYIHGFYSLCELLPLYPSRYGRFEVLRETCSYLTNCRATNTKLSKNYIKNRNIKDLINFYGYLRVSLKGGLGPVDLPIEVH